MRPCPDCRGEGVVDLVQCPGGPTTAVCLSCQGMATISEKQHLWKQIGEKMRIDRVSRGVSLRQEAVERGITAEQLSHMEWGRAQPEPVRELP